MTPSKEEQKKLLADIMEQDQKNGLYSQQTAVDWLYNKLSTSTSDELVGNINNWFQQAKQMEKEQIKEAYIMSLLDGDNKIRRDAEDYYNETKSELQEELIAKQSDLIKELKEQIKHQQEIIAVLKEYHTTMDKLYDHQSATIKDLISRTGTPSKCAYCGA